MDGSKKKFRTEKVVPDGEYGWIIVLGSSVALGLSYGFSSSFGLMYNDFLKNLNAGTKAVSVISSVFSFSVSLTALVGSAAQKKFSLRSIAIFGGSIYFLSSLLNIFATSVEHLIITEGLMHGISFGILLPASYAFFNQYFNKRRVFAITLAKTLQSVIKTVCPMIVHYTTERYGFRGMLAIVAAINAHAIVGMLLLHPVEWHYKEIQVPNDESKDSMISEDKVLEGMISEDIDLAFEEDMLSDHNVEEDQENKFIQSSKNSIWRRIIDLFDLKLFKDITYMNLLIGITVVLYSDGGFFTLLPFYMLDEGFSKENTAVIISASSAADLGCRVLMAIISLYIHLNGRIVFLCGTIGTMFLRYVFMGTTSFTGVLLSVSALGFVQTFMFLNVVISFAEYLPAARFHSGYGLFIFFTGIFFFILGPVNGVIRDATNSYIVCFHMLTGILAICIIPWTIEIVWTRLRTRKTKSDPQSKC